MSIHSKQAIKLILDHEGGYVNDPRDPGGPTNKGITIKTFRAFIKKDGSIMDLKSLTTEQATIVYKRRYWDAVMADYLPNGVGYAMTDFAVNSGPRRAILYIQKIVGARQDGRMGPATLKAIETYNTCQLINELCDDRLGFMQRAKDRNGNLLWPTYKNGWSTRVGRVREQALKWA